MGALTGLKVLDLSRVLAGPTCTQTLSDLGAEVWKVEPLWGDETRQWGPPYADVAGEPTSAYFMAANRGKRSLALNLKAPAAQQVVRELALRADVVVENFKVGDLARFGLDASSLLAVNPRLVYCSITGFGQTGPRAAEPGYDLVAQGYSGILSVTGEPGRPPMKVGVAWIDLLTAHTASTAILACLYERSTSGLGQAIDLSLFDVGLAAMANLGQLALVTGSNPARLGNSHSQIMPYGVYRVSDGWIVLAGANDHQFAQLCAAMGSPELAADPAFRTNELRLENRALLDAALDRLLSGRSQEEVLGRLHDLGVPCGPVNDLQSALRDPQVVARGTVVELDGNAYLGSPLTHLSRTPGAATVRVPKLGEDTRSVLRGVLGLSGAEIDGLIQSGAAA